MFCASVDQLFRFLLSPVIKNLLLFTSWTTLLTLYIWGLKINCYLKFLLVGKWIQSSPSCLTPSFLPLFVTFFLLSHIFHPLSFLSFHTITFLPLSLFSYACLPFLFLLLSLFGCSSFCFPLPFPSSLQPAVIAGAPWRLLRSAGSGQRPRWSTVVQLHTTGATDPGEPPHQSSPGQGHLHGQATPGGRWGGRGPGGGGGRGVAAAWTWGEHVGYPIVCVLFSDLLFPPGEGRPQTRTFVLKRKPEDKNFWFHKKRRTGTYGN